MQEYYRDTWAEIDLDAIAHNVKQLKTYTQQRKSSLL